jgi:hypothetical protein
MRSRFDEAATRQPGQSHPPGDLAGQVALARSLVALGDLASARDQLEQILRAAPDDLAALGALAGVEWMDGNHDRALELEQRVEGLAEDRGGAPETALEIAQFLGGHEPPRLVRTFERLLAAVGRLQQRRDRL